MEKVDARSLSSSAKEHIRQLAVKAVLNGEKQKEVAELLGVTPQAFIWLRSSFTLNHTFHPNGASQILV